MSRKRLVLGELEAAALNVLWDLGTATVAEVVAAMPEDRTRHYNTVSTVLSRLEKRGLVACTRDGRVLRYSPQITRDELGRQYLSLLRADLFGGSLTGMVSALLGRDKPSAKQTAQLRRLLDEIEEGDGHVG